METCILSIKAEEEIKKYPQIPLSDEQRKYLRVVFDLREAPPKIKELIGFSSVIAIDNQGNRYAYDGTPHDFIKLLIFDTKNQCIM